MPPSPAPQPRSSEPLARVQDRVLLHLRRSTLTLLEHVPANAAGAVLPAGEVPLQHRRTVGSGRPAPLVLDPARYRTDTATPQAPFRFPPANLCNPDGDPGRALKQLDRCPSPFDALLTPTGLLASDRTGIQALLEAVRLVQGLRTRRLVLALPLGPGWLTRTGTQVLAALLAPVSLPKALVLDGEHGPVGSVEELRALRCVLTELPGTAVLGATGLTALDALAHGAPFVSVDAAPRSEGPSPPGVLHHRLLTYLAGPAATAHLQGLGRCCCEPCLQWGEERAHGRVGRPYAVLGQDGNAEAAHAHNLTVVSDLARKLTRGAVRGDRTKLWRRMCTDAVREHDWHRDAAGPALPSLGPSEELLFRADHPAR
ncbi:hypothetical protein [Nocardiopsis kunsanensis]|uniref:hypothetical protein n=1 Tax=Nocardiopsis kunsanensis TaxID=141693 RepID=UPI00034A583F|nr:hypothetical protein [Nocardiopsis kunsanensis]